MLFFLVFIIFLLLTCDVPAIIYWVFFGGLPKFFRDLSEFFRIPIKWLNFFLGFFGNLLVQVIIFFSITIHTYWWFNFFKNSFYLKTFTALTKHRFIFSLLLLVLFIEASLDTHLIFVDFQYYVFCLSCIDLYISNISDFFFESTYMSLHAIIFYSVIYYFLLRVLMVINPKKKNFFF